MLQYIKKEWAGLLCILWCLAAALIISVGAAFLGFAAGFGSAIVFIDTLFAIKKQHDNR